MKKISKICSMVRPIKFLCLVFVLFEFFLANYSFCQKKPFVYKKVTDLNSSNIDISNYLLNGDITNYLPRGYSKRGDVDYTVFIQKAIDKMDIVVLPPFPIAVNSSSLKLKSNFKLIFQPNSKLVMLPNKLTSYCVLGVVDLDNVTIINANIEGDRYTHLDNRGEWGMGIYVENSRNVKILNPKIRNCWGDGIYIGRNTRGSFSRNIEIIGGWLDNNRRNGISVISVDNLKISNIVVSNSNGTSPMSGIDFEPNKSDEILKNIRVQNVRTFNNGFDGLRFVFTYLQGSSQLVNISVNGHRDYYSYMPISFFGAQKELTKTNTVGGEINYSNCFWYDNQVDFGQYFNLNLPVRIKLSNVNKIQKGKSRILQYSDLKDINNSFTIGKN
ncbi:right-handed parallel beta-helix repeat-containing protein [Sphingobacterium sp.]|uniref:right-handed parallel beta-helix repeat-containing protein n=1 Tax=Sphingobacterium sp. TaxID=341027 RepID=UPI0031E3D110